MIRCCILSDSHVSALLEAKLAKTTADAYEFTIFTAPANYFSIIQSRDGRLYSDDPEFSFLLQSHSGGKEEIAVADYDEFVVLGLDYFSGWIVSYYDQFVFDAAYDRLDGAIGDKYLLSDACFSAVCEAALTKTAAMSTALALRAATDAPVTLVAAPNPGAGLSESEMPEGYPPFHALARDGLDGVFASLFEDVSARLARKHKIAIVPPLREAAENGAFNRFEHSLLSQVKPDASVEERLNAAAHGNGRYGKLLIEKLFRKSA